MASGVPTLGKGGGGSPSYIATCTEHYSLYRQIPDEDVDLLEGLSWGIPKVMCLLTDLYQNTRGYSRSERSEHLHKHTGDTTTILDYAYASLSECMKLRLFMLSVLQTTQFSLDEVKDILEIDDMGAGMTMAYLTAKQLVENRDSYGKVDRDRHNTAGSYLYTFHSLVLDFLNDKHRGHSDVLNLARQRLFLHILHTIEPHVPDQDNDFQTAVYEVVTQHRSVFQTFFNLFDMDEVPLTLNMTTANCRYLNKVVNLIYYSHNQKVEVMKRIRQTHEGSYFGLFCRIECVALLIDDEKNEEAITEGWCAMEAISDLKLNDEHTWSLQAAILYQLGRALRKQKKYKESLDHLNNALKHYTMILSKRITYTRSDISNEVEQISSLIDHHKNDKVEFVVSRVIEILQLPGDHERARMEMPDDGKLYRKDDERARTEVGIHYIYELGCRYRKQTHYKESCDCFNKVVKLCCIINASGPWVMEIALLNDALGNLYFDKKEIELSLFYHKQAVTLSQSHVGNKYHPFITGFEFNVGTTYGYKSQIVADYDDTTRTSLYKEALQMFNNSMDRDKQMGYHKQLRYVHKLNGRSSLYGQLELFKESVEDRDEQLEILEQYYKGAHREKTNVQIEKADILLKMRKRLLEQNGKYFMLCRC